ncbi:MAG: beta strand repeat-containing protein, partial [Pseudochelatococcus sp.]|uniref:beta strand repeat-containing protein n=1 Tax=Pseudochelatococcus sp. TaxID=2020869 RepID=UPI003D90BE0A
MIVTRRTHLLLAGVAGVALMLASGTRVARADPPAAGALPSGGAVLSGQASITAGGNGLTVRQGSGAAVISWQDFSIGRDAGVHFDNGGGATLNRVRGNVPSRIDGSLTATGSVYLVNKAGIAVGPTGRIETGGSFVGSTLDIADDEFHKAARGKSYTLKGDSDATVVNAGRIGSLGGDVALVARKVENSGTIEAPQGTAALVAGREVLVQDRAHAGGRFTVKVGGADTEAKNTGVMKAAEVELRANGGNVYALAGNRNGTISATGTAKRGGRVFLTAGDGGNVEVRQKVTARKADGGGAIRVSGKRVTVAATLDASGLKNIPLPPARPAALAEAGDGGSAIVSGREIALDNGALIDVSGARGGVALVGGDYQGGKDAANNYVAEQVATAQTLTVAEGAEVRADGHADAGRIVLWSDERTDFAGHVNAQSTFGRGGDAEVSGKAVLGFTGTANLLGETGAGTLLLDPYNLTISSAAGTISGTTAAGTDSVLNVDALTGLLAGADVIVSTGSGGSQDGNITVAAAIGWSDNKLTLNAAGNILINAPITATGASAGLALVHGAGKDYSVNAPVTLSGASSTFSVNGADYTLIRSMSALDAIPDNATSRYALAVDLDAAGPTYSAALVGTGSSPFAGTFAGLGHTISNLTIDSTSNYVGLFGATDSGAVIRDIGLVGGSVKGSRTSSGTSYIGSLVGYNNTATGGISITNAYATGKVEGSASGSANGTSLYVGGLIGFNRATATGSISITNAYATGEVTENGIATTGSNNYIGGFVGRNETSDSGGISITNAYATGKVTGSGDKTYIGGLVGFNRASQGTIAVTNVYATGDVSEGSRVGGLVGSQTTSTGAISITNAYATGKVSGSGSYVGGLVAEIDNTSPGGGGTITITNTYVTGEVTGSGSVGGLVGYLRQSSLTNSYWDRTTGTQPTSAVGTTSGTVTTTNLTGITTAANAFLKNTYGNFNFDTTWYILDGETRPFLRSEWSPTIRNSHQLQLMAMDLSASYTLAADIDLAADLANDASMWKTEARFTGSSYGFAPIGSSANPFTGTFDGQGNIIDKLTIRSDSAERGLFGAIGTTGKVWNVGLTNVDVRVVTATQGVNHMGGLAGQNAGEIKNTYVTGVIQNGSSTSNSFYTGGLAGENTGIIENVYSTATVSGRNNIGGLVGENDGANARIENAYATGNVSSSAGNEVGGLVGFNRNNGTIRNTYATGNVSSIGYRVGGLVGNNQGKIFYSYATGKVTGNSANNLGALVGSSGGTVTQSYWNKDQNSSSPAGTGLTMDEFRNTATFMKMATAWDFKEVWAPPGDGFAPELYALAKVIRVHADDVADAIYGDTSASWQNGVAPGVVTYGKDKHISGDASYNGYDTDFGDDVSIDIAGLNAGSYTVELAGANGDDDSSKAPYQRAGYRYIYTADVVIGQRAITIAGGTVQAKDYDGGTDATIATHATPQNILAGDASKVTLEYGTATFEDKDAGTGNKQVNWKYELNLTDTAVGNYILADSGAYTTYDGTIRPKTITASLTGSTAKVYDGGTDVTDFAAIGVSLDGIVATDTVSVDVTAATGAYDD